MAQKIYADHLPVNSFKKTRISAAGTVETFITCQSYGGFYCISKGTTAVIQVFENTATATNLYGSVTAVVITEQKIGPINIDKRISFRIDGTADVLVFTN